MSPSLRTSSNRDTAAQQKTRSSDAVESQSVSNVAQEAGQDGEQNWEPNLACTNCRRRKLKCSRHVPSCQQCRRAAVECEYKTKRGKTGMKTGAIETLHKRIDALEESIQGSSSRVLPNVGASVNELDDHSILSFLSEKLRKFSDGSRPELHNEQQKPAAKRRRVDEDPTGSTWWLRNSASTPERPHQETLDPLLKAYFLYIHPWIPVVHQGRLRKRILYPPAEGQQQDLDVVLTAIRVAAARFIEDRDVALACLEEDYEKQAQIKDWIILQAMKKPCVESLQALIIVVFHDINSGEASSTWSIIGSLTRTAEYLQLTVERSERDAQARSLIRPHTTLPPTQDWTEEEERRRVFWTIFNLDRYCSVTMGWNTSLTSRDVSRRLPSDGLLWRKESPVSTPFFGIWDNVTGSMGNPISYYLSHTSQARAELSSERVAQPLASSTNLGEQGPSTSASNLSSAARESSAIDMSTVGAFAYSIEATESLSRVTTYFLQQPKIRDELDLPGWITRFKELDLRLVHWKMLLPQKWKADNVTQRLGPRMDPNLTLAHITHNTSMILLHQVIAFPLRDWDFFKHRLPSSLSADTCQAAAVEIATIARNFLDVMKRDNEAMPVAPLFTFCVYIAGRFLLLLWRAKNGGTQAPQVLPQFWSLLGILGDAATRWAGPHRLNFAVKADLATKYLNQLQTLHKLCTEDPGYHIDPLGYTQDVDPSAPYTSSPTTSCHDSTNGQRRTSIQTRADHGESLTSGVPAGGMQVAQSLASYDTVPYHGGRDAPQHQLQHPHLQMAQSQQELAVIREQEQSNGAVDGGNGTDFMMQMLMDDQFMDLDRVISYEDGIFGPGFEGASW